MEHGSPADNLQQFSERVQVTGNNIQLLNIQMSDMGSYTLTDRDNRKVKVITPNFICEFLFVKSF